MINMYINIYVYTRCGGARGEWMTYHRETDAFFVNPLRPRLFGAPFFLRVAPGARVPSGAATSGAEVRRKDVPYQGGHSL